MKKNIYKPKLLVEGWKLGEQYEGKKYVAIPEKYLEKPLIVVYGNEQMRFTNHRVPIEPVVTNVFDDKFGRGKYKVHYYVWQGKPARFGQPV